MNNIKWHIYQTHRLLNRNYLAFDQINSVNQIQQIKEPANNRSNVGARLLSGANYDKVECQNETIVVKRCNQPVI